MRAGAARVHHPRGSLSAESRNLFLSRTAEAAMTATNPSSGAPTLGQILVTGATGGIGAHLVDALDAGGAPFAVTCRRTDQRDAFRARGIQAVSGDFSDATSIRNARAGLRAALPARPKLRRGSSRSPAPGGVPPRSRGGRAPCHGAEYLALPGGQSGHVGGSRARLSRALTHQVAKPWAGSTWQRSRTRSQLRSTMSIAG